MLRPGIGEWNVISSSEKSADGKESRMHTLATTGGVKTTPGGGKKTFGGISEDQAHRRVEGDDKNYVKSEGESSKTELSEHLVSGNDRDGKVEKFSKSYQTSSSHSVKSKKIINDFDSPDFAGTTPLQEKKGTSAPSQTKRDMSVDQERLREETTKNVSQEQKEYRTLNTQEQHQTTSATDQQYHQQQSNRNQPEQKLPQYSQPQQGTPPQKSKEHLQTSKDELRTREAFRLAEKPGDLIARTVVHSKPDVICITETKLLTDGTKVTTKRYERVNQTTDIETLRRQFGATDTSSTQKRFSDQKTNQQTNLRQGTTTPTTTRKHQTIHQDDHVSNLKKDESSNMATHINKESVTTTKITSTMSTDNQQTVVNDYDVIKDSLLKQGKPDQENVTRIERTEYRETMTPIPIVTSNRNEDIVIEERFVTHIDKKDNVRRDSYTKTEVTESKNDSTDTSKTTVNQQPVQKQPQKEARDTRISVEIDKAHAAWASSLRCLTPPPEGEKQPTPTNPHSRRTSRPSPSRDSDVSDHRKSTNVRTSVHRSTEKRLDSSPERRPSSKGRRYPETPRGRPTTDSDSAEERVYTSKKTSDRSSTVRETNSFIKNESILEDVSVKGKYYVLTEKKTRYLHKNSNTTYS